MNQKARCYPGEYKNMVPGTIVWAKAGKEPYWPAEVKRAVGQDVQVHFLGSTFVTEVNKQYVKLFVDHFPKYSVKCSRNEFTVGMKIAVRMISGKKNIESSLDDETFMRHRQLMESFMDGADMKLEVEGGTHYTLGLGTIDPSTAKGHIGNMSVSSIGAPASFDQIPY